MSKKRKTDEILDETSKLVEESVETTEETSQNDLESIETQEMQTSEPEVVETPVAVESQEEIAPREIDNSRQIEFTLSETLEHNWVVYAKGNKHILFENEFSEIESIAKKLKIAIL